MRKIILLSSFLLLMHVSSIFATDWYVRPAGGNYGSENGTSYANAWDGLLNVVWGYGGLQAGDTLYICGCHIHKMTTGGWIYEADIDTGSGSPGNPITIRGDLPGDPGIVWGCYIPSYELWRYEGNNTYSITLSASSFNGYIFEDIGNPNYDSYTLLTRVSSLVDCKVTAGSFYFAGTNAGDRLYIHCSDGGDPTDRIAINRWGYEFLRPNNWTYVTFKNIKIFCMYRWFFLHNANISHITFDGCTIHYSESDLFAIGNTNNYLTIKNCDLGNCNKTAIYIQSNTNTAPSYYTFSGNTIHDCGTLYYTREGDKHGIGIQGGHDGVIEDNTIYNAGEGIVYYLYDGQSAANNICRRNFIKDLDINLGSAQAIVYGSTGDTTLGDTSGNKCYQNIVIGGGQYKSRGIYYKWPDAMEIYNNVIYNFDTSIMLGGTYNDGSGVKGVLKNNISLAPVTYHIEFMTGASEGNYKIESDYNLFYPISDRQFYFLDTSAAGKFDLSQWQSFIRLGCTFDPNSLTSEPKFTNASGSYSNNTDFQLRNDSPAIDAGIDVGLTHDYDGTLIHQGFAPDIGAFECVKPIYIKKSASPLSGDIPLVVNFTSNVMGDYPPFTFLWNFGDGSTSNQQNPSHNYPTDREYKVTLTITDSNSNQESGFLVITAHNPIKSLTISSFTGAPSPGEGGTTEPPPGAHLYSRDSSVQVRAIPNPDYRLSKWRGDVSDSYIYAEDINIILDTDKSISSLFYTKCGDVNGDKKITAADAQIAFEIFLGKISNPTECQKENADVNCDGTKTEPYITAADAQAIFEKFIGKIDFPCNCSGESRKNLVSNQRSVNTEISIINNSQTAKFGQEVSVSILMSNPSRIKSFGFDINFPSEILEFAFVERTDLSEDFVQIDAYEMASGVLRVGGYNNSSITTNASDILVTLVFKAMKNIEKRLSFSLLNTFDDIRNHPSLKERQIKEKIKIHPFPRFKIL